jgi:hypothetical protein
MRKLFIDVNNNITAERIRGDSMFIEDKDGYHIAPVNSIYRHAQRKDDSIVILAHDRITAVGETQTKESVNRIGKSIDLAVFNGQRLTIDTTWGRWLKMVGKYAIPIGVAGFMLLIGIQSLMSGGAA